MYTKLNGARISNRAILAPDTTWLKNKDAMFLYWNNHKGQQLIVISWHVIKPQETASLERGELQTEAFYNKQIRRNTV